MKAHLVVLIILVVFSKSIPSSNSSTDDGSNKCFSGSVQLGEMPIVEEPCNFAKGFACQAIQSGNQVTYGCFSSSDKCNQDTTICLNSKSKKRNDMDRCCCQRESGSKCDDAFSALIGFQQCQHGTRNFADMCELPARRCDWDPVFPRACMAFKPKNSGRIEHDCASSKSPLATHCNKTQLTPYCIKDTLDGVDGQLCCCIGNECNSHQLDRLFPNTTTDAAESTMMPKMTAATSTVVQTKLLIGAVGGWESTPEEDDDHMDTWVLALLLIGSGVLLVVLCSLGLGLLCFYCRNIRKEPRRKTVAIVRSHPRAKTPTRLPVVHHDVARQSTPAGQEKQTVPATSFSRTSIRLTPARSQQNVVVSCNCDHSDDASDVTVKPIDLSDRQSQDSLRIY